MNHPVPLHARLNAPLDPPPHGGGLGLAPSRWPCGRPKTMTLPAEEFIRRFLLHVLPHGFHRIRSYGFLGNRDRHQKLARCQSLLGVTPLDAPSAGASPRLDYRDRYEALTGVSLRECPACHQGRMLLVEVLAPGGVMSPNTS